MEPLTVYDKSTSNPNKDVKEKRQVPTTTISAQTRLHLACNEQESAVSSSGIAQRSDLLLMKIQNTVFPAFFVVAVYKSQVTSRMIYIFSDTEISRIKAAHVKIRCQKRTYLTNISWLPVLQTRRVVAKPPVICFQVG